MNDQPVYMIGIAAKLAGVHPQTLRIYERKRLICPQRTVGSTRLYSQRDIERLRLIKQLTQELGMNLAGVEKVFQLTDELDILRVTVEALERELDATRRDLEAAIEREPKRDEIAIIPKGEVVLRRMVKSLLEG